MSIKNSTSSSFFDYCNLIRPVERPCIDWPMILNNIDINDVPSVRNGLMAPEQAAYSIANKSLANPDSKDLTGIHVACGPDLNTILLATDAVRVIAVDTGSVKLIKLKDAKIEWCAYDTSTEFFLRSDLLRRRQFHNWNVGALARNFERLIILELNALGINKNDLSIKDSEGNIQLSFPWKYPGKREEKLRTFTLINADIIKPDRYPGGLRPYLEPNSIDFYYQKSAMFCLHYMDNFMPNISSAVKDFILINPSILGQPPMDIKNKLSDCLSPRYKMVRNINDAYYKYFPEPEYYPAIFWEYNWLVELWKKNK